VLRSGQLFRFFGCGVLLASSVIASVGPARATIVERVVAVVAERPILLSELRRRAAPFLATLSGSEGVRASAQSKMFSEMLQRMIDEELIQRAASRSQIEVSKEEVESAIERVAKGNGVSVGELLTEVERSGVSPTDYRRELRSQLLDAKVMNLRLQGRIRVTEDEMRETYDTLLAEEQKQLPMRLAVIRLSFDTKAAARTERLAAKLVAQARAGQDFAALSRAHSTDEATRAAGGLLEPLPPSQLPAPLRKAIQGLQAGQVSEPVQFKDTFVVLKVVERAPSTLPPFEEVLPQLEQRVQLRKMEKARRAWLDSLRKTTHVEVRL